VLVDTHPDGLAACAGAAPEFGAIRSPEACVAAADNPILSSQYGDHTMYTQVNICFTRSARSPRTRSPRCFGIQLPFTATVASANPLRTPPAAPLASPTCHRVRHRCCDRIARIPTSGGHGNDHRDCADRALDQLGHSLEPSPYPGFHHVGDTGHVFGSLTESDGKPTR